MALDVASIDWRPSGIKARSTAGLAEASVGETPGCQLWGTPGGGAPV